MPLLSRAGFKIAVNARAHIGFKVFIKQRDVQHVQGSTVHQELFEEPDVYKRQPFSCTACAAPIGAGVLIPTIPLRSG